MNATCTMDQITTLEITDLSMDEIAEVGGGSGDGDFYLGVAIGVICVILLA